MNTLKRKKKTDQTPSSPTQIHRHRRLPHHLPPLLHRIPQIQDGFKRHCQLCSGLH
ncbi:uncharacterized protein G2W53_040362 [Senna tora]|uniref:Uncharacterized protein n=1 Tax=Senna tora TaxID=362788 RepID=A0A834SDZ1_9FABA|nr:uncharacterized protein G2W53_040362 [Senna tora]